MTLEGSIALAYVKKLSRPLIGYRIALKHGIGVDTVAYRIKSGLSLEQALTKPVRPQKVMFRGELASIAQHCRNYGVKVGQVYYLKGTHSMKIIEALDIVVSRNGRPST